MKALAVIGNKNSHKIFKDVFPVTSMRVVFFTGTLDDIEKCKGFEFCGYIHYGVHNSGINQLIEIIKLRMR